MVAATFCSQRFACRRAFSSTVLRSREFSGSAGFGQRQAVQCSAASDSDVVVPSPSYAIPAVLLAVSGVSAVADVKPFAFLTGILGVFLAVQASRVKFKFTRNDLEVLIGDQDEKSENAFVGGENKWSFDTFVNWEFWWPNFPVLVYFKETQTKPEGQIHFFPIIFDGKTLYETMLERCGTTQNSGLK